MFQKKIFSAIAGLSMLASGASLAGSMGAVDEPIKLAVNEWTGQHITTHVAGEILKRAGYNVGGGIHGDVDGGGNLHGVRCDSDG